MTPKPTWRQMLLGIFIVWQLVFIVGYNAVQVVPLPAADDDELSDSRAGAPTEHMGLPQVIAKPIAVVGKKWAYLTGQMQAWWLFAPTFPHQATFPAVVLHYEDRQVEARSSLEPIDPQRYFRFSGTNDRLFHYEVRLGLIYTNYSPEWFARAPEEWRDAVISRVHRQRKSMRAYLRWRLREYQREHPDAPTPRYVDLIIRLYPTPALGHPRQWEPPHALPLARWHPTRADADESSSIEAFDMVKKQFVPLAVKSR